MNQNVSALVLGVLFVAGCSSEQLDRPATYKVSGTVTYRGQPVPNADLTFYNEGAKRSAFGKTDIKGQYQLTTFGAHDGAVEGKHDVTVLQLPPIASTPTIADTESDAYSPPGLGMSTDPVPSASMLPQKYANRATSGLLGIVNADNANVIDFELTD